jgi:hypothetical protein
MNLPRRRCRDCYAGAQAEGANAPDAAFCIWNLKEAARDLARGHELPQHSWWADMIKTSNEQANELALKQQFLDRAAALSKLPEVFRCQQVTLLIC